MTHATMTHPMTTVPLKKLVGSVFSNPYTLFCLICTINSELNYFLDLHHEWMSRGRYLLVSSGWVRHPLDSKKLFVRWHADKCLSYCGHWRVMHDMRHGGMTHEGGMSHGDLWVILWPPTTCTHTVVTNICIHLLWPPHLYTHTCGPYVCIKCATCNTMRHDSTHRRHDSFIGDMTQLIGDKRCATYRMPCLEHISRSIHVCVTRLIHVGDMTHS